MKIKPVLLICLLMGALLVFSGCSEKSVYDSFAEDGFNVSVRFDANGGILMDGVTALVDTFNISGMEVNSNGEVEIALLDPADQRRGHGNVCTPSYDESGYYLAGWYSERTENPNGKGYTYSKPWNFETDRVCVKPNGEHKAGDPVVTLYAVWRRLLTVEVYDRQTNQLIGEAISYDPTVETIKMPKWNPESDDGSIEMYQIPTKSGYTFDCAYYDLEGTRPIETDVLVHTGETDENATTMPIYVDWMEGEWYHIYTAEQFIEAASLDGNYIIHDDLDFSKEKWPTDLMYGKFSGTISSVEGSHFSLQNITATQTYGDKGYAGLFGQLTEEAAIRNITFDNVTFTIQKGNSGADRAMYFGLLAGYIVTDQIVEVEITNSRLQISDKVHDPNSMNRYAIGLICAMGDYTLVDSSGITCGSVGDNAEALVVEVDGNSVEISLIETNS